MKKNGTNSVLFLCTGNSCRSQMAEAIVNADPNLNWRAFSAGTKPARSTHHLALQVLEEIGINHQGEPKDVDTYRGREFDLVITVCDQAAEECPIWLGRGRVYHKSFQDPVSAKGSEEEVVSIFRMVRDQIKDQIPSLLIDDYQNEDKDE